MVALRARMAQVEQAAQRERENDAREIARLRQNQSCRICYESFDSEDRRPALANCTHVFFCEACLLTEAGEDFGKCTIKENS